MSLVKPIIYIKNMVKYLKVPYRLLIIILILLLINKLYIITLYLLEEHLIRTLYINLVETYKTYYIDILIEEQLKIYNKGAAITVIAAPLEKELNWDVLMEAQLLRYSNEVIIYTITEHNLIIDVLINKELKLEKEIYIDPYYIETPQEESSRIRLNRQIIVLWWVGGFYFIFGDCLLYTSKDWLALGLCLTMKILCRW
jgi:hypothetical protein